VLHGQPHALVVRQFIDITKVLLDVGLLGGRQFKQRFAKSFETETPVSM
jgi:hypothetical protein